MQIMLKYAYYVVIKTSILKQNNKIYVYEAKT